MKILDVYSMHLEYKIKGGKQMKEKPEIINEFRGEYYFLSNFYAAPVMHDGIMYKNNEAAFQAAKIADVKGRFAFSEMDPSSAKKAGRHVKLRSDWEDVKTNIMYEIVLDKFTRNRNLREKLIATGDRKLEEGNTWGDRIWGTVNGIGENRLGKILMDVREICNKGSI